MNCRHCGARAKIVDSRPAFLEPPAGQRTMPSLATVWRRRKCPNGHKRETIEVPVGPTIRQRLTIAWDRKEV